MWSRQVGSYSLRHKECKIDHTTQRTRVQNQCARLSGMARGEIIAFSVLSQTQQAKKHAEGRLFLPFRSAQTQSYQEHSLIASIDMIKSRTCENKAFHCCQLEMCRGPKSQECERP